MCPVRPAVEPIKELIEMFRQYLNPTPRIIAERYKFYERNQKRNQNATYAYENVSEYIAALRKLTEHCEFGAFLNEALRDKFVWGNEKAKYPEENASQKTFRFKESS